MWSMTKNKNLHLAEAANCGPSLQAISPGINAVPSAVRDYRVSGVCVSGTVSSSGIFEGCPPQLKLVMAHLLWTEPANSHGNEATKTFDSTATRPATRVVNSKAAAVTDVGTRPAESKVSVTGGLSTLKPSVCTTCGNQTGIATTKATGRPTPD